MLRRRFLQASAAAPFFFGREAAGSDALRAHPAIVRETIHLSESSGGPRWPKLVGSPVLDSLRPAIERSREVHTNVAKIRVGPAF